MTSRHIELGREEFSDTESVHTIQSKEELYEQMTLSLLARNRTNLLEFLSTHQISWSDKYLIMAILSPEFDLLLPQMSKGVVKSISKTLVSAMRIGTGTYIPDPLESPDNYSLDVKGVDTLTLGGAMAIKKALIEDSENYEILNAMTKLDGRTMVFLMKFLRGEIMVKKILVEPLWRDILTNVDYGEYVASTTIPMLKVVEKFSQCIVGGNYYIVPAEERVCRAYISGDNVKVVNMFNSKLKYVFSDEDSDFNKWKVYNNSVVDVYVEGEDGPDGFVISSMKLMDVLIWEGSQRAYIEGLGPRLKINNDEIEVFNFEHTSNIEPGKLFRGVDDMYFLSPFVRASNTGIVLAEAGYSYIYTTKNSVTLRKFYAAEESPGKLIVVGFKDTKKVSKHNTLRELNGKCIPYDPNVLSTGTFEKVENLLKPEYMTRVLVQSKKISSMNRQIKMGAIVELEELPIDVKITTVAELTEILCSKTKNPGGRKRSLEDYEDEDSSKKMLLE